MPFLYSSESGQLFTFQEYDFHKTSWYHGVSGVYIFARYSNLSNAWNCIYIGETDSFGRRMYQHKHAKWPEAVELGAHAKQDNLTISSHQCSIINFKLSAE